MKGKPRIVRTEVLRDGTEVVYVENLHCKTCAAPVSPTYFDPRYPLELLCDKCQRAAEDDYGNTCEPSSEQKPMRYFASEASPGQSSGKIRKNMWSMGNAENANGIWDNLQRAREDWE